MTRKVKGEKLILLKSTQANKKSKHIRDAKRVKISQLKCIKVLSYNGLWQMVFNKFLLFTVQWYHTVILLEDGNKARYGGFFRFFFHSHIQVIKEAFSFQFRKVL